MTEKKLKIDDNIHLEEYDRLRFNPSGEQHEQDIQFYKREKNLLETGVVYTIIGIGIIIGLGIFLKNQSYHSKQEKTFKQILEKKQDNEKKKRDFIEQVNSVKNSFLEIKETNIAEYASTEVKEAEKIIANAEIELGKYNFEGLAELIKKAKDKLEEASVNAKKIMDKKEREESEKKKIAEEKKRIEEEKQKRAEKEKGEKEKQKQREDALQKLQELQKILNK